MYHREIISRLTGIPTPIYGVAGFLPPESERAVARELLAYLEDKRFLFRPYDREEPGYVVRSLDETRSKLSELLPRCDRKSLLGEGITAMRGASRDFMDKLGAVRTTTPSLSHSAHEALGELRSRFGIHIGRIAVAYAIDISDELGVAALPPAKRKCDSEP